MICLCNYSIAEKDDRYDLKSYEDTFGFKHSDPMQFLEFLRSKKNEKCPTYSIHGTHPGWVKESHIPELISVIDSDEQCANVCMTISSFRDCNKSTIGREATFLIEGFRKGKYPPALNSGRADLAKVEIENWWRDYSSKTEKKSWHVSPSINPRSSTIYPYVDWSVIESLHLGMSAENAAKLVHDLQYYHHPINAIVFSEYKGIKYEVALKLSKDKNVIVDISYKKIE